MKKGLFYIITLIIPIGFFSCSQTTSVFTSTVEAIKNKDFEASLDNKTVQLYTLTNGTIGMKVTNYGARVVALCVPDKDNKPVDVVLGYNTLNEYLNNAESYLGAAIGRYGNRIGAAQFPINNDTITITANEKSNHLHGGKKGFFAMVWDAEQLSDTKITFRYLSVDGEEGYPGNLSVEMTYELTPNNALKIDYKASTDQATICNLTNHSYFNLSGEGHETINDHVLKINSSKITPVDSNLIPTGSFLETTNTPFDFREPTAIGKRVLTTHKQITLGGGYDHNWVLDKQNTGNKLACEVFSPISNIKMEVITNQPGIQFYGGNFIDGSVSGKSGKKYKYRSAFCLETQHYPDSPNKSNFPSTQLNPGDTYAHSCSYQFSVIK